MNGTIVSLILGIYQLYELYWIFMQNNLPYYGLIKYIIFKYVP
jgi:hypothetical protein